MIKTGKPSIFARAARRYIKSPYAIRRVEEADNNIDLISKDDITNFIILLNMDKMEV